ncbi:MAG: S8 family serine peptidase [Prochloraceae cyanobacterium]|nr:S8 family serine peptidase [Prochloraceae cyanobacterium]
MNNNQQIIPSDPLFKDQWHLLNTGQNGIKPGIDLNVVPVWSSGYTGKGVKVGILEGGGTDTTHPDLAPNYDTNIDYNAITNNRNVYVDNGKAHATATAGLIGAAANNNIGGVGVAYDATIANFQFDYGSTDTQAAISFNQALLSGMDVISNSWGTSTPFYRNFSEARWSSFAQAIENSVKNGRGGLGTVIVKSAGNYRRDDQWTNGSNFVNSPYTIAVAGVGPEGDYRYSSSTGPNILVAAPTKGTNNLGETVGIVTTDVAGSGGYKSGDYTDSFSGTSASAPMVAGVVALMLQANPLLGYRDVQEILAYSARRYILNDPTPQDSPWAENGANNSNGGGLHHNLDYGFGLTDAHAAVRLAESWKKQQVFANEQAIPLSTTISTSGVDANGNSFIASEITVNSALELDQVEVNLDLRHSDTGELTVVLQSPSGSRSTLINSGTVDVSSSGTVRSYPDGKGKAYEGNSFKLSSTNFWGESAEGTWKIIVTDTKSNSNNSTFNGWTLTLRGDALTNDNTYIYNDEFANFTADNARKTLKDTSGIDTINAAAVTSDIDLHLAPGIVNTLAGNTLTIANGTTIENASGGDGNDKIIGNGANNTIKGYRGNDYLRGNGGNDSIFGGTGDDNLQGNTGADLLSGGDGNDYLRGGSDSDTLIGGAGQDAFVFNGLKPGVDIISDFKSLGEADLIKLSASGFGGGLTLGALDASQFTIGSSASSNTDRIIYNSSTGGLFFDIDGMGGQNQVRFASLSTNLALSNNDFAVIA